MAILITKQYIYIYVQMFKKRFLLIQLAQKVYDMQNLERIIAVKQQIENYESKWAD